MAFTYTDYGKTLLHTWGRFRVTLLEAVVAGDLLSMYNTDASYTVQFADQSDSQAADCIACEAGAAGDEIWACLKAECKASTSIGTGGAVTQNYFAASTDFFGAKLYLGEDGKPSTTLGTTFTQVVGMLLARDRILLDPVPTSVGPITETLSGSSALDAVRITATDATTGTSGYARGLYVTTSATGTKTVSGEHNAVGVDMAVSGDTPYAYIQSLYLSTSGNPTIGLISAISVYLDNPGTAVTNIHLLDLQVSTPTASAPSTREAYMRIRNHGTGTPTCVMFLQANNGAKVATNFIETGSNNETGPVAASTTAITSGTNSTYRIRCLYGSTTFYLIGVAAA